jgi:hypothetical protein
MKMGAILSDCPDFKTIHQTPGNGGLHLYEKLTQTVPKTYPSLRRF